MEEKDDWLLEAKKRITQHVSDKKISLRGVYHELGLDPSHYSRWEEGILKLLAIDGEKVLTQTKGRPSSDFLISQVDAKRIITHSKSEKGVQVREALVVQNERMLDLRKKYDANFFKSVLADPENMNNLFIALVEKNKEIHDGYKSLEVAIENRSSVAELRSDVVKLVNEINKKKGIVHGKVWGDAYKKLMDQSFVSWKDEFHMSKNKLDFLSEKSPEYFNRLKIILAAMLL